MKKWIFLLLTPFFFINGEESVSERNNAFANQITPHLIENRNAVFSPYSLFSALAIPYAGASQNTKIEMKNALFFPFTTDSFFRDLATFNRHLKKDGVKIANALWIDRDSQLLPAFENTIEPLNAKVSPLNFANSEQAASIINEWVENETENKIQNLISPSDLSALTRMVVTNALYFSGAWKMPFSTKQTMPAPFKIQEGISTTAQMMKGNGSFPYIASEKGQMLSLPIKDSAVSLWIYLPKEGIAVEEDVMQLSTKMESTYVQVELPKFTIRSKWDLNTALKALGMQEAFTKNANFYDINGLNDLFITKVMQEALVEVNEGGIVAAAATGVVMNVTAMKEPPIPFIADHPFSFYLVHVPTQTLLMMGKLVNP